MCVLALGLSYLNLSLGDLLELSPFWRSSFFSKNTLCYNQTEYSNYELITVGYRVGCTF